MVGLGLNINNDSMESISSTACSLKEIVKKTLDPFHILTEIEKQFFFFLNHYHSDLIEEIRLVQYLKDKLVTLELGAQIYTGSYVTIDSKGGLILDIKGIQKTFYSGHIVEINDFP